VIDGFFSIYLCYYNHSSMNRFKIETRYRQASHSQTVHSAHRAYVFCTHITTNSDCYPMQHSLTGISARSTLRSARYILHMNTIYGIFMFDVNRLTSKNACSPECDAMSFNVRFPSFRSVLLPASSESGSERTCNYSWTAGPWKIRQ
jgi:hypothetical protein